MPLIVRTSIAGLLLSFAADASAGPFAAASAYRAPPSALIRIARPEPAPTTPSLREPGLDDDGPDPLIRNLQKLLDEVGFYFGDADGRMNSRLETSIRNYQRRASLPVDGEATAALRQHIETFLLKSRLNTRLADQAKKRKIAARSALLAQPETRRLVARTDSGKADEVADPTRDPSPCFRVPTARCLLREAIESAKPASLSELRDWAYGDVVAVQARADMIDEAFETAGRIEDPRYIVVALRHIAEAQAANGELAKALKTTALVPNALHRAAALKAIAARLIGGGDRAAAAPVLDALEAAAADLTEPGPRASVLASVALGFWRIDARARAVAALQQARRLVGENITGNADGKSWFGAIARVLAEMNRPDEALAVLDRIDNRWHREQALLAVVKPLAANGHAEKALAAARGIGAARYRAVALAHVAGAGDGRGAGGKARQILDEAIQALREIKLPYARGYAAAHVAATAVALAGLDRGVAIAQEIEDTRLRARTLWEIVLLPAATIDAATARRVHAKAVAATDAVDDAIERVLAYAGATIALARVGRHAEARGDFERALGLAGSIGNAWGRARALTKVAEALIVLEELAE